MRLAMSILVRDEADIIEENIRFHAAAGVDCFIVTDHGSKDGTRDILASLSKEFELDVIDECSATFDQDLWVSRMAHRVRYNNQADWIINNNADEFWFCDLMDLRQAISTEMVMLGNDANTVANIHCERNNMLPSREQVLHPEYTFKDNVFKAVGTVQDQPQAHTWHECASNTLIRKIPGRVISRIESLSSVGLPDLIKFDSDGNARANQNTSFMLEKTNSHFIRILHYPVRNFTQFESKIINYGQNLTSNKRLENPANRHMRFWYELYMQGELYAEYLSMVLPEIALQQLIIEGKIKVEDAFAKSDYQDAA